MPHIEIVKCCLSLVPLRYKISLTWGWPEVLFLAPVVQIFNRLI
jgi:hypothetical protein